MNSGVLAEECSRLGLVLVATGLASVLAGCADGQLTYAEESVRVSASALAEVQSSGGENEALAAPLDELAERLDQTERAIDVWRDHSGSLAYRMRAPCLRAALVLLRETLIEESLPVPTALDEADALLEDVGGTCRTTREGAR